MPAGFLLIHARPNRATMLALSWLLFAAGVAAYLWIAQARHRENAEDTRLKTVRAPLRGTVPEIAWLQPPGNVFATDWSRITAGLTP